MFDIEPAYNRLNIALVGQRIFAFAIDLAACSFVGQFIEAFLGIKGGLRLVVFTIVWGLVRIVFAAGNQGQSWGHYALSLRIVDMNHGRSVEFLELAKREGAIFIPFFLLLASVQDFRYASAVPVFVALPLVVDIAFAFADNRRRQALHDRLSGTIVVLSRRGMKLDQKFANLTRTFNKTRQRFADPDSEENYTQEYYDFEPPTKQRAYREEEYPPQGRKKRRRY